MTFLKGFRFTRSMLIGILLLLIGGFVDGAVEGFEFDGRTFFERKFHVEQNGFWGSQSWRMVYVNGDPEQGFKSSLHRWSGAFDFYHVGDDLRKSCYIVGAFLTGVAAFGVATLGRVALVLSALLISGFLKFLGMSFIRS